MSDRLDELKSKNKELEKKLLMKNEYISDISQENQNMVKLEIHIDKMKEYRTREQELEAIIKSKDFTIETKNEEIHILETNINNLNNKLAQTFQ